MINLNIIKMFINIWIPAVFVFSRSLLVLVLPDFLSDQKSKFLHFVWNQRNFQTMALNMHSEPLCVQYFFFSVSPQRKIYKIFAKLTHISDQTSRWEREKKFFDSWPCFMSRTNEMRSNLIVDMANVIFFQVFRSCKRHRTHERMAICEIFGWLKIACNVSHENSTLHWEENRQFKKLTGDPTTSATSLEQLKILWIQKDVTHKTNHAWLINKVESQME